MEVNLDRFSGGIPNWITIQPKQEEALGPLIRTEAEIERLKRFDLYEEDEDE